MTNRYVRSAPKTLMKWHSMEHEEMNRWFRIWGIIGQRRQINPVVALMPYFDRGPGPDVGR